MVVFHSELLLIHKVTQNFDNAAVLVRIFERYECARRRGLFGKADACYCASKLKQAMMAFLMGAASGWLVLRMVRMVRI